MPQVLSPGRQCWQNLASVLSAVSCTAVSPCHDPHFAGQTCGQTDRMTQFSALCASVHGFYMDDVTSLDTEKRNMNEAGRIRSEAEAIEVKTCGQG